MMATVAKRAGAATKGAVNEFELRIAKLPKKQRTELAELGQLLASESSERERLEIVRTMWELLFPERLEEKLIAAFSESEEAAARKRLDAYRLKVGKRIRERRNKLHLTQEELAEKAGIPQSHVSRLETGMHAATFATIERVAKALKTPAGSLDPGFDD